MIVLALDTTTAGGSCAVLRDDEVCERGGDARLTHGERLPRELVALLEACQLSLSQIDVFGVAIGPGAFTGLRIGVATMQGLAFAEQKPLVGIVGFDALALLASTHPWVRTTDGRRPIVRTATWIDAWRGEVYTSLYSGTEAIEEPRVESPGRALERLGEGPVIFTGDGVPAYRERIREASRLEVALTDPVSPLLAGAVARLTAGAVRAGIRPSPDAIRPVYVRRSDAELARDAHAAR